MLLCSFPDSHVQGGSLRKPGDALYRPGPHSTKARETPVTPTTPPVLGPECRPPPFTFPRGLHAQPWATASDQHLRAQARCPPRPRARQLPRGCATSILPQSPSARSRPAHGNFPWRWRRPTEPTRPASTRDEWVWQVPTNFYFYLISIELYLAASTQRQPNRVACSTPRPRTCWGLWQVVSLKADAAIGGPHYAVSPSLLEQRPACSRTLNLSLLKWG